MNRWPSAWWSRFRRKDGPDLQLHPPEPGGHQKPFAPGMTLGPGESTQIPLDITTVFRDYPRILEAIKRGEMQVGVTNGPRRQTGPASFETTATITIDGYPFADVTISFNSKEPS